MLKNHQVFHICASISRDYLAIKEGRDNHCTIHTIK